MACPSGRIQIRRDNYEAWEAIDPLLNAGELGYAYPSITDPLKEPKGVLKIGGLYGSRWKTATQLFPISASGGGATGPTQTTAPFQFIGISGGPTITNIANKGYTITINSTTGSPSLSDQVICVNPQLFNLATSGVVFTCRLPDTTDYGNNKVQVGFGDAFAVLDANNKLSYYVDDTLKDSNISYTPNQTLSITYNGSGQVVFKLMNASSGATGPTGATGATGAIGAVLHDIKSYPYTASEDYGFIGYRAFDEPKQTIITYANVYPVGVQGIQGVTGPSGVQGMTGASGVQGETGPQGVTGPSGVQGMTGASGPQGVTGASGVQGVTGASGVQGVTGVSGVQGETGPQGSTGPSGVQGLTGPQGVTGPSGVQGETGPQGVTGPSGVQGLTGPQGSTGPSGVQGVTGASGVQGITGASGVQGLTGPQGVTGASGVQGVTGVSGVQGETGPQGVTGASGVQGVTGPSGVQGVTGPSGVQGLQGVTGASGPAGPSSSYFTYQADNGVTPTDGHITWSNFGTQNSSTYFRVNHIDQNGVDIDIFLNMVKQGDKLIIQDANVSANFQTWLVSGSPIPNNGSNYVEYPVTLVTSGGSSNFGNNHGIILALLTSGVQGVTGPSGVQGLTGPQGVTGASGVQGVTGPSGVQGVQGVTGASGVQGVTGPSGAQGFQGITGPVPTNIVSVTVTTPPFELGTSGTFYNITNSGLTALTTPSGTIANGSFWVLRNNTSTYLSMTPQTGNTTGLPSPLVIPPFNSVTLVWSSNTFILY